MQDTYPAWDGWRPPVGPAGIEPFTLEDAAILLDGEETLADLRVRAKREGRTLAQAAAHGYHRYGLGIKSSEFPYGWDARQVLEWVDDIVWYPSWGGPGKDDSRFNLFGAPFGVYGKLSIRFRGRWEISTAYPTGLR